jgi:hypothetical protein
VIEWFARRRRERREFLFAAKPLSNLPGKALEVFKPAVRTNCSAPSAPLRESSFAPPRECPSAPLRESS